MSVLAIPKVCAADEEDEGAEDCRQCNVECLAFRGRGFGLPIVFGRPIRDHHSWTREALRLVCCWVRRIEVESDIVRGLALQPSLVNCPSEEASIIRCYGRLESLWSPVGFVNVVGLDDDGLVLLGEVIYIPGHFCR